MTEHNTNGPRPKPDEMPDSFLSAESSDAVGSGDPGNCEYGPRVSAYHDGEVSEAEASELARHMAGCQACAEQLAFFGKVSSTFEAAPMPRLSPDARERLEALGDQSQSDRDNQSNRFKIKPPADVRWVRRLTAAAAILFVIAAGKLIYDQTVPIHGNPTVVPALDPRDVQPTAPRSIAADHTGTSTPPVTNADYLVGGPSHKPTTGQTDH